MNNYCIKSQIDMKDKNHATKKTAVYCRKYSTQIKNEAKPAVSCLQTTMRKASYNQSGH